MPITRAIDLSTAVFWSMSWMSGLLLATSLTMLQGCQTSNNYEEQGSASPDMKSAMTSAIKDDAKDVGPLQPGADVPAAMVKAMDGTKVDLGQRLAKGQTVLVFFRGGWCPFCTKHLAELQGVLPQINAAGYEVIAIAPDTVTNLKQAGDKHDLSYTLLADEQFEATKAFGLAFYLDDATINKYKGYGIPLYSPPGDDGTVLPVPAVFAVEEGEIIFTHYDPNYKQRLSADALLEAIDAK